MNKQELIKNIRKLSVYGRDLIEKDEVLNLVNKLDEPEAGHADKAPRYVKNVLARLRELPLHDREIWLKAIMGEFEQDFSHAKWREGYEQGKFEGAMIPYDEPEKVKVPQFVADWIEVCKAKEKRLLTALLYTPEKVNSWVDNSENQELFALAWILGYEVEKEKQYRIKLKSNSKEIDYLVNTERNGLRFYSMIYTQRREHTRKELEDAGFGWVFDCPGIEVEEVE